MNRPDLIARFRAAVAALRGKNQVLRLDLNPIEAWALWGALQLARRHEAAAGPLAQFITAITTRLEGHLAEGEPYQSIVRMLSATSHQVEPPDSPADPPSTPGDAPPPPARDENTRMVRSANIYLAALTAGWDGLPSSPPPHLNISTLRERSAWESAYRRGDRARRATQDLRQVWGHG
jgi:hypothetical protein